MHWMELPMIFFFLSNIEIIKRGKDSLGQHLHSCELGPVTTQSKLEKDIELLPYGLNYGPQNYIHALQIKPSRKKKIAEFHECRR
jgi:hypothetical protein